jgi:hypothetical protein
MLSIHAFHSTYLVNQNHPSPDGLRERLDDVVLRRLPDALEDSLGGWEQHNPGLWFIRNLDLSLDINAGWDDELIAHCWAESIARTLNRITLETDGNSLHFANQAEYLARFLIDLADGHAWQQWYYRPFSGLRVLPDSQALCAALEKEPDDGLAALLRLSQTELEKVLALTGEAQARKLLMAFAGQVVVDASMAGRSSQDALSALWEAWRVPRRSLTEAAEALFHYITAVRANPASTGLPLAHGALALTRLSRQLQRENESAASRLLGALAGGDAATLNVIAGARDGDLLRPLLSAEPEWLWQVGRELSSGAVQLPVVKPAAEGSLTRITPFGGAFLLLPLIDRLPLTEATRGWPDLQDTPAEPLIRFLILIKCLGHPRALSVFADPLLRDLLGIPPILAVESLTAWQRVFPASKRVQFSEVIATWQEEQNPRESQKFILSRLPGSPQVVLLEENRLMWRYVGTLKQTQRFMPDGSTLTCEDEGFRRTVQATFPDVQVLPATRAGASDDDLLVRLAKIPEDMSALHLPEPFEFGRDFEQALDLAAQNVLRLFAWRLTGFSRSGLAYLQRNFLDLTASLEEEAGRRVVRLSRPPLGLILNMTSQNRQVYRLSWLDDRPFELYPED